MEHIIITPVTADRAPAFVVTANGTREAFSIDDDAFSAWVTIDGSELRRNLPDLSDDSPGSTLSELVYRALSAGVITGDPGVELNVHSVTVADEVGYIVRLNNHVGGQQLVGLTRGWHEFRWPPIGLAYDESARYHLQEICDVANALLDDLSGHSVSVRFLGSARDAYQTCWEQ